MSYSFTDAFNNAFPARKPFPAYQFPKLNKTVSVTKFSASGGSANEGSIVPIPVKQVTTQGLVTSYRFKPVLGIPPLGHRRKPSYDPISAGYTSNPVEAIYTRMTGLRKFDPFGNFSFYVQIGQLGTIAFQKFSGLDIEIDEIEYKDGVDGFTHKRPGMVRYGNLTLTKGVMLDRRLWDWLQNTLNGVTKNTYRNGSLVITTDSKNKLLPLKIYNFYHAWPKKWSGIELDAQNDSILIEELELCVDYVETIWDN